MKYGKKKKSSLYDGMMKRMSKPKKGNAYAKPKKR